MEYKYMCIVDTDNVYKDLAYVCVKQEDDGSVSCEVQEYKLQDNEHLLDAEKPTICRCAGGPGFVRPKWDADTSAWTEAATDEEIAAWETEHPAPEVPEPEPTEQEQMRADIDFLAAMTGVSL